MTDNHNIEAAPGFWPLMTYLASVIQDRGREGWHDFSVSINTDGRVLLIADASLTKSLFPPPMPAIEYDGTSYQRIG